MLAQHAANIYCKYISISLGCFQRFRIIWRILYLIWFNCMHRPQFCPHKPWFGLAPNCCQFPLNHDYVGRNNQNIHMCMWNEITSAINQCHQLQVDAVSRKVRGHACVMTSELQMSLNKACAWKRTFQWKHVRCWKAWIHQIIILYVRDFIWNMYFKSTMWDMTIKSGESQRGS